jgi:hypothetical protein
MVCQLRPLVNCLGLNNPPRICLTPRKSRVKNVWRIKQGNCRCKMAGAGIRSFAKFRGQMPRISTTGITSWQTALKWTADCQVPRSGCRDQVKPVAVAVWHYHQKQSENYVFMENLWNKKGCWDILQDVFWLKNYIYGKTYGTYFR